MGGYDACGVDAAEDRHERAARASVKIRGGFVENKYLRTHSQHGGQCHGTLLAAAQLHGRTFAQAFGSHCAHGGGYAHLHLSGIKPHVEGAECHIFLYRGHEQLVVRILKHHPYTTPHIGKSLSLDRHAAHHHLAGRRQQQSVGV